jgi:hypothetical protein
VKRKLRFLIVIALTVATGAASLRAQEEKKETLGDKIKKLFVRPTPTPTPRKKHRSAAASPTVSPTETSISSTNSSPEESAVPSPSETTMPVTTVTPIETQSKAETQYFEAVRPISPGPHTRPRAVAPRTTAAPQIAPGENTTPIPENPPEEALESRPMPSLPPMVESTPLPGTASNSSKNVEMLPNRNRATKNRFPSLSATDTFQVSQWINRANHPIDQSACELTATPPAWMSI